MMETIVKNEIPEVGEYSFWQYGCTASKLVVSGADMSDDRKAIIRIALESEIKDIRTYSGYKGDLLVQIVAAKLPVLEALIESAEALGMQTVLKKNPNMLSYELYCVTPDDVYELKVP